MEKKYVFTKDMTLMQVVEVCPSARHVLMGFGMHCIGCPVSQFETLEEASVVHGVELDYLLHKLDELNEMDLEVLNSYNNSAFDEF